MSGMYEPRHEPFEDFMTELEAEAAREGPDAVAELHRLREFFANERETMTRDASQASP